jgi:hypothetical protein
MVIEHFDRLSDHASVSLSNRLSKYSIADPVKAQELSDGIRAEDIQKKLDEFAWKYGC